MRVSLGKTEKSYKHLVLIKNISELLEEVGQRSHIVLPPMIGKMWHGYLSQSDSFKPARILAEIQVDYSLDDYVYAPPTDKYVDWTNEDYSLPDWAKHLGFYTNKSLYFFVYSTNKKFTRSSVYNPF